MQDKETKDWKKEIQRVLDGRSAYEVEGMTKLEIIMWIIDTIEQEAERRGYMRGCNDMFGDLLGVYNPDKKLFTEWLKNRLKLLEEENGKQNAR